MKINSNIHISTGIDIVNNKRISNKIYNLKFIQRILSTYEIEKYNKITNISRKIEFLAGRFAAKESIVKSLSFKINFNSFSIFQNQVYFLNKDSIISKLTSLFNKKVLDFVISVSISHEKDFTVASSFLIIFFES